MRTDPREAPRAMAQDGMFWEFVPEDVIGVPAELTCAGYECEWRVKKDIMEKTTGGTWTEFEWSPRPLQLREYALMESWDVFVDDKPFCRDACFKHANGQSKAGLSCDGDGQDLWMGR